MSFNSEVPAEYSQVPGIFTAVKLQFSKPCSKSLDKLDIDVSVRMNSLSFSGKTSFGLNASANPLFVYSIKSMYSDSPDDIFNESLECQLYGND